jgi:hypothetical protein
MTSLEELMLYRVEMGVCVKVLCTPEEITECESSIESEGLLPEGFYWRDTGGKTEYYKYVMNGMTDHELQEYLLHRTSDDVRTIRNIALYFSVVLSIALVITVLSMLGLGLGLSRIFSAFG